MSISNRISKAFRLASIVSLGVMAAACEQTVKTATGEVATTLSDGSSPNVIYTTADAQRVTVYKNTGTVRLDFEDYTEGLVVNFRENQFCTFTTLTTSNSRSDVPLCKKISEVEAPENIARIEKLRGYLNVTPVREPAPKSR